MVIVALSLPLALVPIDLVWARVDYWTAANALAGVPIPPDYSPPIYHI